MRFRLPSTAAAGLLAIACGAGDSELSAAAFELRFGHLERAEAVLAGVEGPQADHLRARIAAVRARRAAIEVELEDLEAAYAGSSILDLMAELEARRDREDDPLLRERLELEISRAYDRRAEQVATRAHARPGEVVAPPGAPPAPPPAPRSVLTDPVLEEVLADVVRARQAHSWAEADGILRMVLDDAPGYGQRLAPLLTQVSTAAAIEGRELLRRADELVARGRTDEASALLLLERWRFPDRGESAEVHRRCEALAVGPAQPGSDVVVASVEPGPGPPAPREPEVVGPTTSDLEAIDLAVQAVEAEGRAALVQAAELWGRAAQASRDQERARYELRGFAAQRRHALRAEVARAFADDPGAFASSGVTALTPEGLTINGARVSWSDLVPSTLRALVEPVALTDGARVGLALEKLDRDQAEGPRGGLADLKRLLEDGAIDQGATWRLVAGYRREALPGGGYRWRDGTWVSSDDLEREALGAELESLVAQLVRADHEQRDPLLASLQDHARTSQAGREALDRGLRGRFERAVQAIEKGRTLEQLERIARLRAQLDAQREYALDLIYDHQTYFYPYDPPAAGTGKTRSDYWAAQREVDERVAALRELWENEQGVALPAAFRGALGDLDWIRARRVHLRGPLLTPEHWPPWLAGIDPDLARITLRTFAGDARERAALARDRRVRAWNEARWAESDAIQTEEKIQVRVTNDYRQMLGRRALAWNARIQEAADWHSNYMANTGNFGHSEPEDAANRTPFDRMRRVGYARGASENCHRGSGGPRGAHDGWTHSSGHHRNLLMASHQEMASAVAAGYWTQNFGSGSEFETELDAWRD